MNLYYVYGYLWLYIFVNVEFYCNFCIYNAVSVYLLPGVEFVLYIKDHNGNKFYLKLYCVILDELSVFTTVLSNIKKERDLSSAACALLTCVCVNTWLLLLLFVMCSSVGLISWFCPLSPCYLVHLLYQLHPLHCISLFSLSVSCARSLLCPLNRFPRVLSALCTRT